MQRQLTICLFLLALPVQAQDTTATRQDTTATRQEALVKAAREAALPWLALLDAGEYEESWETASASFQQAVTMPQWRQALVQAYASFDTLTSRTYLGGKYLTSLPGAPEGEYVVMQFSARFGTAPAIETVTFVREGNTWKAAGYFVKPR